MANIINNKEESRYEVSEQGQTAYLQYARHGARFFINTVSVPKLLESRGIGSALMKTVLDEARDKKMKVTPFCAFAAHYIREHSEYHDLVPEVEEA